MNAYRDKVIVTEPASPAPTSVRLAGHPADVQAWAEAVIDTYTPFFDGPLSYALQTTSKAGVLVTFVGLDDLNGALDSLPVDAYNLTEI